MEAEGSEHLYKEKVKKVTCLWCENGMQGKEAAAVVQATGRQPYLWRWQWAGTFGGGRREVGVVGQNG